MISRFLAVAVVAGLVGTSQATAQPNSDSANYLLEACKQFLANDVRVDGYKLGVCAGRIKGMMHYNDGVTLCSPPNSTFGQTVRVVVSYIEARPARMHENFIDLAHEAVVAAWPCSARRR